MILEDSVSTSSKRWPCAVAANRCTEARPVYPNNFHATVLCSLKTLEFVCIYTARSSRPPAGRSWWVWIGPLALRVKRGSGAGSCRKNTLLRQTETDEAPRRFLFSHLPHSRVQWCEEASRFDSRISSSGTMEALDSIHLPGHFKCRCSSTFTHRKSIKCSKSKLQPRRTCNIKLADACFQSVQNLLPSLVLHKNHIVNNGNRSGNSMWYILSSVISIIRSFPHLTKSLRSLIRQHSRFNMWFSFLDIVAINY